MEVIDADAFKENYRRIMKHDYAYPGDLTRNKFYFRYPEAPGHVGTFTTFLNNKLTLWACPRHAAPFVFVPPAEDGTK